MKDYRSEHYIGTAHLSGCRYSSLYTCHLLFMNAVRCVYDGQTYEAPHLNVAASPRYFFRGDYEQIKSFPSFTVYRGGALIG
jgi:hypothetical protein